MNPNSKLTKFLKCLYRNRGKKLTAREISQQTGIGVNQMSIYHNRTFRNVEKKKIDGLNHFWLNPDGVYYIKKILIKTFTNPVTGEMDEQGID